jgi:hypothetical protein
MNLNDLLADAEIDPQQTLVLRHRPREPQLHKVLPWLVAEKPSVFNAYQQAQGEKVEKVMQSAKFIASFLGREAGKALFVGLYEVKGWKPMTLEKCRQLPEAVELMSLGMNGFNDDVSRPNFLWFDLERTTHYESWIGKLVVHWPAPEISWWRRAHRNEFSVHAIHEESMLDAVLPNWDKLNLTWDELLVMPKRLQAVLREWRGIYFVFDSSDGKAYVGSASGDENILSRWLNYKSTGDGGNKYLKKRDPRNFRFTILQRVSPDMNPQEVVQIENTWKARLHTRHPFGLNDN